MEYSSKDFILKTTPFINYFSNYIFLRPTVVFSPLPDGGQIYKYSQTEALTSGFEIASEYHPLKYLHLEAGAEYVYTYNLQTGMSLPFIPPFAFTTEAEISKRKMFNYFRKSFIGLQVSINAAQNRTERNERSTPGYTLVNFTSGTTFKFGKNRIEFLFRINNLFNSTYFKHLSRYRILNLPEPGRNFMITLKIPFNLI